MFDTPKTTSIDDVVKHSADEYNVSGVLPVIMDALSGYLKAELEEGRISEGEYAVAYSQLITTALDRSMNWQQTENIKNYEAELARLRISHAIEMNALEISAATANLSLLQLELADKTLRYPLERDILDVQKQSAEYDLTNLKPQELASAQAAVAKSNAEITHLQTQEALTNAQVGLTNAKTLTEGANLNIATEQVTLYANQAKAFELKHNLDVAKTLSNTYVAALSQDLPVSSTSTVFGQNIGTAISKTNWV